MSEEEKKTLKKNAAKREVDAAGGSTMPPVPEREVDYRDTSAPARKKSRQHDKD
ncbi:MAG: hypothetical protein ACXVIG_02700 [Halobacteriota archaeon]